MVWKSPKRAAWAVYADTAPVPADFANRPAMAPAPPRFMQSIVSLPVAERSAQRVEVIDQGRSAGPLHKLLLPPGREPNDDMVGGQARVVHGGNDAETRGDVVAAAVLHRGPLDGIRFSHDSLLPDDRLRRCDIDNRP